jgi:hypothetical protein
MVGGFVDFKAGQRYQPKDTQEGGYLKITANFRQNNREYSMKCEKGTQTMTYFSHIHRQPKYNSRSLTGTHGNE